MKMVSQTVFFFFFFAKIIIAAYFIILLYTRYERAAVHSAGASSDELIYKSIRLLEFYVSSKAVTFYEHLNVFLFRATDKSY